MTAAEERAGWREPADPRGDSEPCKPEGSVSLRLSVAVSASCHRICLTGAAAPSVLSRRRALCEPLASR